MHRFCPALAPAAGSDSGESEVLFCFRQLCFPHREASHATAVP